MSRFILVLGCHRSGTSLITNSLRCLGVELGTKLQGPAKDNVLGFGEDIEFQAVNQSVLEACGADWHTLGPVDPKRTHASQIVRSIVQDRIDKYPIFGLKDPRMCRLLTYWRPVFESMGVEVSVVYVLRHPLSVAASLADRNQFSKEKSLYLWLVYMLEALVDAPPTWDKVLVDYTLFMEDPAKELERISSALNLELKSVIAPVQRELQHHKIDHGEYPTPVAQLYSLLHQIARDKQPMEYPSSNLFFSMRHRLDDLAPLFGEIDRADKIKRQQAPRMTFKWPN